MGYNTRGTSSMEPTEREVPAIWRGIGFVLGVYYPRPWDMLLLS